jgi:hypothetical protein
MCCVGGGSVISHDTVKMAIMKDTIQDLGRRVRGIGGAINLVETYGTVLNLFMCGEILDVEMMSAAARASDENGARIVFRDKSGLRDGETQVT